MKNRKKTIHPPTPLPLYKIGGGVVVKIFQSPYGKGDKPPMNWGVLYPPPFRPDGLQGSEYPLTVPRVIELSGRPQWD